MKEINLTIIADRHCQTTYSYLEYMKANNFLPKKILLVDFLSNNKKVRLIQKFLGKKITSKLVSFYKRNKIKKIQNICNYFQVNQSVKVKFFGKMNYKSYAKKLDKIIVNDYAGLKEYLIQNNDTAFLYAGGGIVPEEILSLEGVKIIHIHPGVVPFVKGSDGLFWSILERNKIGMSCFYMNAGIDTGDIIKTKEYEIPNISIPKGIDNNLLYKALLFSFDPHYRADILMDVLNENYKDNIKLLKNTKQDPAQGKTYFSMHKKLLKKAIDKIVSYE